VEEAAARIGSRARGFAGGGVSGAGVDEQVGAGAVVLFEFAAAAWRRRPT
jgi:hypothetical protein